MTTARALTPPLNRLSRPQGVNGPRPSGNGQPLGGSAGAVGNRPDGPDEIGPASAAVARAGAGQAAPEGGSGAAAELSLPAGPPALPAFIRRQIERLLERRQSDLSLVLGLPGADPVRLRLRVVDGQVEVRVASGDADVLQAVAAGWPGLARDATRLGVDLLPPRIESTAP